MTPDEILNVMLKQHTETINELHKVYTNYTKAPIARRTLDYLQRVEKNVKEMWIQFLASHEQIKKMDPEQKGEYFTRKLFESSKRAYDEYILRFEADRKGFKNTEENPLNFLELKVPEENISIRSLQNFASGGSADELNTSVKCDDSQAIILQIKLNSFNKKMKLIHEDKETQHVKSYYTSVLQSLQKRWEEIEGDWFKTQALHFKYNFDAASMASITTQFQQSEDFYPEVCKSLHQKLQQCEEKANQSDGLNIPLPPLKLVPFSGKAIDWPNFCEYYETTIHNNPAIKSNVVKNDYLCSLVTDKESLAIVGHLLLSATNYESTWSLLKDRIGNPRRICDALLDKFIDIPKMEYKSATNLKEIHDKTKEVLFGLYNQGLEEKEILELIIMRMIHIKLDSTSIEAFEKSLKNTRKVPPLDEMLSTLLSHAFVLENVNNSKMVWAAEKSTHHGPKTSVPMSKVEKLCSYCNKTGHVIVECSYFCGLSIPERLELAKIKQLCYNCLSHVYTGACPSKNVCRICQKGHHTILHLEPKERFQNRPLQIPDKEESQPAVTLHIHQRFSEAINLENKQSTNAKSCVLLPTARINCINMKTMKKISLRTLIDQCATHTFITSSVAEKLNLQLQPNILETCGLGEVVGETAKNMVEMMITPHFNSKSELNIQAHVLHKISDSMPAFNVSREDTAEIKELLQHQGSTVADPEYYKSNQVDMIIGSDYFNNIILTGLLISNQGPIAQQTRLGWIISGPIPVLEQTQKSKCNLIVEKNTNKKLQKFLVLEETPQDASAGEDCKQQFQLNTTRETSGRKCTSIPLKETPDLDSSRGRAIRWLRETEKDNNPQAAKVARERVSTNLIEATKQVVNGVHQLVASRGSLADVLMEQSLWVRGPAKLPKVDWKPGATEVHTTALESNGDFECEPKLTQNTPDPTNNLQLTIQHVLHQGKSL